MPKNLTVDFQDLEPLIIRGKNAMIEKKLRREGKTETKVKNTQGETNNKMRKIEQSTDVEKIKTINSKVSKAIISGRVAKKMNRKQLALVIQENVKVVEQYETCKAIPNIKIINKFQKALGVKLTGVEFK